jgi:hypothetical protein
MISRFISDILSLSDFLRLEQVLGAKNRQIKELMEIDLSTLDTHGL